MRGVAMVVFAAVFAASGVSCAQLAGIDDTNSDGLPRNSVAIERMSIGKTVEREPLDLTGLAASYLVDKGAGTTDFDRVPASAAGGTWVTELRTPAPVTLTLPGDPKPLSRLYAFPDAALSILYAQLERRDRSPAPDGAMLTVTAHLDAATTADQSFQIFTVGSWTSHPLPVATVGGMDVALTYPFGASTNLSGRPQLDRLTTDDVFLILRYADGALTGVAEAAPFAQSGDDTVTATMAPVPLDRTLDVKISPDIARRYFAVRPAVDSLTMTWSIVAAPGAEIASNAGPTLRSGGLMASDVGVNVLYGNPFAAHGWNPIFTLTTSESRIYKPSETVSVTLYAGMTQYVEPAATAMTLGLDAGLPELISIDGRSLSTDGQTVPRPTGFTAVSFIANPSANTLFGVQLYDLLPSEDGTRLEGHLAFDALGTEPTFHLPPEIFEPGHSYTLRAQCIAGGFPAIEEGNLVTRQLPLSHSYLDSGVFTVMP